MARQIGAVKISGTLDDLTFYKMDGEYLARKKTSLNKKRVMKDAAFENSRKAMLAFGVVSTFCAGLYRQLPKECRGKGIQQRMTGRARNLFLEGLDEETVTGLLLKEFGE